MEFHQLDDLVAVRLARLVHLVDEFRHDAPIMQVDACGTVHAPFSHGRRADAAGAHRIHGMRRGSGRQAPG